MAIPEVFRSTLRHLERPLTHRYHPDRPRTPPPPRDKLDAPLSGHARLLAYRMAHQILEPELAADRAYGRQFQRAVEVAREWLDGWIDGRRDFLTTARKVESLRLFCVSRDRLATGPAATMVILSSCQPFSNESRFAPLPPSLRRRIYGVVMARLAVRRPDELLLDTIDPDELFVAARSGDSVVGNAAAIALTWVPTPEVIDRLIREWPVIRPNRTAWHRGYDPAIKWLISLRDHAVDRALAASPCDSFRVRIAEVASQRSDPVSQSIVEQLRDDPCPEVRRIVWPADVWQLERDRLFAEMSSPVARRRRQAWQVLRSGRIVPPYELRARIRGLLQHHHWGVRLTAVRALPDAFSPVDCALVLRELERTERHKRVRREIHRQLGIDDDDPA